jgi:hypothetical protein
MKTKEEFLRKWVKNTVQWDEMKVDLDSLIQQSITEHDAFNKVKCTQHFIVNGKCQNCDYQVATVIQAKAYFQYETYTNIQVENKELPKHFRLKDIEIIIKEGGEG